ncbi:hypothetical protein RI367_001908 [Sorochytrium milnesiophthora]
MAHATSYDTTGDELTYYELLATPTLERGRRRTYGTDLHKRSEPRIVDGQHHHISADDSFRMIFSAYNRTFFLHMKPNPHVVHPDATVEVHREDGTVERKPLRDAARVYAGTVYADREQSDRQWELQHMGVDAAVDFSQPADQLLPTAAVDKARIVMHHDGMSADASLAAHYPATERPVLYAQFTWQGDHYSVVPTHIRNVQKRSTEASVMSISSRPQHLRDATMMVYRESDTRAGLRKRQLAQGVLRDRGTHVSCGAHELAYNRNQTQFVDTSFGFASPFHALLRRQTATTTTPPAGCPADLKFVYMGVAADCAYSSTFGNSEKDITTELINIWDTVRNLYEQDFRVGVGIQTLTVRLQCGPEPWNKQCNAGYPIENRLSDFSQWRGQQNSDEGLWHLVSNCPTLPTVGIAWSSTICQTNSAAMANSDGSTAYVSGTAVSTKTPVQWKVVAHEIGHNFGAIHDCTQDTCSKTGNTGNAGDSGSAMSSNANNNCQTCQPGCDCQQQFLMNPTDASSTDQFSPGSIQRICSTLQTKVRSSQSAQCFLAPGARKVIEGNVCGNGIKEDGEECDCGQQCDTDQCCDTKCKLKGSAQCSDRNSPGCCSSCQIRSAGFVCRPSQEFCDLQEVCDGKLPDCPADKYQPDGTTCMLNATIKLPAGSDSRTYCAAGSCTNRDAQCFINTQQMPQVGTGGLKSCSFSNDCSMMCASPSSGSSGLTAQCVVISGMTFMDGTECSMGGRCSGGSCQGGNILKGALQWIGNNKTLAIGIGAALGVLLLCCLWSCCFRRCCRRKTKLAGAPPPPPPVAPSARPAMSSNNSSAALYKPAGVGSQRDAYQSGSMTASSSATALNSFHGQHQYAEPEYPVAAMQLQQQQFAQYGRQQDLGDTHLLHQQPVQPYNDPYSAQSQFVQQSVLQPTAPTYSNQQAYGGSSSQSGGYYQS